MNTSGVADAVAPLATEPAIEQEPRWRAVARFVAATAFSAAICRVILKLFTPKALPSHIDIVGYPTFWNINYLYPIFRYRMVVYAFPLLAVIALIVLGWRGPLRRRQPAGPRDVELLDHPEPARMPPEHPLFTAGALVRLVLPAAVVLAAAATRSGRVDGFAYAAGALYIATAIIAAVGWSHLAGRVRASAEHGPRRRREALGEGLALANGVGGAVAAVLGLWFVSRHTRVLMNGHSDQYSWLPLWLAVAGCALVLLWALNRLRRRWAPYSVEGNLLVVVVGSVAVYLATAALPPPVTAFTGFDDSQDLAGSSLLARGQFPWRDFLFIHGLWPDALRANVSAAVFGDSIWGVRAGYGMLLFPLFAVVLYLFAAWLSRGNPWFLLGGAVVVVGLNLYLPMDTRFIVVPVALVLLAETLRRTGTPQARGWCVGLTVVLFASAILIPETSFLAAPALAVVVVAELVHRKPGTRLWPALRLTRWCVGTGLVAALVFAVFLLFNRALGAYVNYYLVFAPGHNAAGAEPLYPLWGRVYFRNLWLSGIVAVLIGIWLTVWRLRSRRAWRPIDWATVAGAGFVALYEEKALGRFDVPHVQQVFSTALPLILLVVWTLLTMADSFVRERLPARSPNRVTHGVRRWSTAPVVNAVAVTAALAGLLSSVQSLSDWARHVGSRQQIVAPGRSPIPRLGYGALRDDEAMLRDLDTAYRAYAGADQPVFDFTNSPGWTYYLLGRTPGSRFYHVSEAIPPSAQRMLIDELKKSRPPVILFDSDSTGQVIWDSVFNSVRSYLVGQYVLDNWVPVLRTHGNLLLLRRDLAERRAPLPPLAEPPQTTNLYVASWPCAWNYSPNYLPSPPDGRSLRLPVQGSAKRLIWTVSGWAADPGSGAPAKTVVVMNGSSVVATFTPDIPRPDVAKHFGTDRWLSGFRYDRLVAPDDRLSLYAETDDGQLHPVPGATGPAAPPAAPTSVRLPDGRVLPMAATPAGKAEMSTRNWYTVGQIALPAGGAWTDYQLATLSAGAQPLGRAYLQITDDPQIRHSISATALPSLRGGLPVRVGSCLQWHGYAPDKPLYIIQSGGTAVTEVTLTGVKDPA